VEELADRFEAPSKGPPPLPRIVAAAPTPLDDADVEELFIHEGIDGHAESLPSSEPDVSAVQGPTRTSPGDEWLEAEELEAEEEEKVEDPARTRRRRAARVGVAWGVAAMLCFALSAPWLGPRIAEGAVASAARPALAETVAHAQVSAATPASPTPPPPPAAVALPRRSARATTASATPVAAPRAAVRKKGSPPSVPAKGAAPARTNRARTSPAPHATSKPHPQGASCAGSASGHASACATTKRAG